METKYKIRYKENKEGENDKKLYFYIIDYTISANKGHN